MTMQRGGVGFDPGFDPDGCGFELTVMVTVAAAAAVMDDRPDSGWNWARRCGGGPKTAASSGLAATVDCCGQTVCCFCSAAFSALLIASSAMLPYFCSVSLDTQDLPKHTLGKRSSHFPDLTRDISDNYQQCITQTKQGLATVTTLVYHTQAPKDCKPMRTICQKNGTMYTLCTLRNKVVCYKPEIPEKLNVTLYTGFGQRYDGKIEGRFAYVNHTTVLRQGSEKIIWEFDACAVINEPGRPGKVGCGSDSWKNAYKHNHKYLCSTDTTWITARHNKWLPCAGSVKCAGWECVCDYTGGGYQGCAGLGEFTRVTNSNRVKLEVLRTHSSIKAY
ncbi:hypothetical protein E2320_022732, partial [Naja naja]